MVMASSMSVGVDEPVRCDVRLELFGVRHVVPFGVVGAALGGGSCGRAHVECVKYERHLFCLFVLPRKFLLHVSPVGECVEDFQRVSSACEDLGVAWLCCRLTSLPSSCGALSVACRPWRRGRASSGWALRWRCRCRVFEPGVHAVPALLAH